MELLETYNKNDMSLSKTSAHILSYLKEYGENLLFSNSEDQFHLFDSINNYQSKYRRSIINNCVYDNYKYNIKMLNMKSQKTNVDLQIFIENNKQSENDDVNDSSIFYNYIKEYHDKYKSDDFIFIAPLNNKIISISNFLSNYQQIKSEIIDKKYFYFEIKLDSKSFNIKKILEYILYAENIFTNTENTLDSSLLISEYFLNMRTFSSMYKRIFVENKNNLYKLITDDDIDKLKDVINRMIKFNLVENNNKVTSNNLTLIIKKDNYYIKKEYYNNKLALKSNKLKYDFDENDNNQFILHLDLQHSLSLNIPYNYIDKDYINSNFTFVFLFNYMLCYINDIKNIIYKKALANS